MYGLSPRKVRFFGTWFDSALLKKVAAEKTKLMRPTENIAIPSSSSCRNISDAGASPSSAQLVGKTFQAEIETNTLEALLSQSASAQQENQKISARTRTMIQGEIRMIGNRINNAPGEVNGPLIEKLIELTQRLDDGHVQLSLLKIIEKGMGILLASSHQDEKTLTRIFIALHDARLNEESFKSGLGASMERAGRGLHNAAAMAAVHALVALGAAADIARTGSAIGLFTAIGVYIGYPLQGFSTGNAFAHKLCYELSVWLDVRERNFPFARALRNKSKLNVKAVEEAGVLQKARNGIFDMMLDSEFKIELLNSLLFDRYKKKFSPDDERVQYVEKLESEVREKKINLVDDISSRNNFIDNSIESCSTQAAKDVVVSFGVFLESIKRTPESDAIGEEEIEAFATPVYRATFDGDIEHGEDAPVVLNTGHTISRRELQDIEKGKPDAKIYCPASRKIHICGTDVPNYHFADLIRHYRSCQLLMRNGQIPGPLRNPKTGELWKTPCILIKPALEAGYDVGMTIEQEEAERLGITAHVVINHALNGYIKKEVKAKNLIRERLSE